MYVVIVEEVSNDDLEDLASLLEELVEEKTNFEKMVDNYKWMKENPDYILLGAKYKDELVGTLMGIVCRDLVAECEPFMVIENVVVKSGLRGKKVGRKLMEEIERIARERGCSYTMLVSSGYRKEAHKFYESVGYAIDAVEGFKKFL